MNQAFNYSNPRWGTRESTMMVDRDNNQVLLFWEQEWSREALENLANKAGLEPQGLILIEKLGRGGRIAQLENGLREAPVWRYLPAEDFKRVSLEFESSRNLCYTSSLTLEQGGRQRANGTHPIAKEAPVKPLQQSAYRNRERVIPQELPLPLGVTSPILPH